MVQIIYEDRLIQWNDFVIQQKFYIASKIPIEKAPLYLKSRSDRVRVIQHYCCNQAEESIPALIWIWGKEIAEPCVKSDTHNHDVQHN